MANTSISNLTASVSNLATTDLLPVVQTAGVGPVKMTGTQLAGGLVGGSTTQIQYNNAGVFGGSSSLVFDNTAKKLTVTGLGSGGTSALTTLSVVGGSLSLSGNISSNAWTTNGIRYANVAATITDLTSSGTVAAAYTDLFGGNTIAASSATTYTNYYTTWISSATAGSNVTFTGKWALGLSGPLDIQAGTVTTTTTPALNLTQTWNAAATFTAIKLNVTDTSSNSGSLLLDIGTGGGSYVSVLSVDKGGGISAKKATGIFQLYDGSLNRVAYLYAGNGANPTLALAANAGIGWSASTTSAGVGDPAITRGGTNTIQLTNSLTSPSNYFYLGAPAANTAQFGAPDAASPVAQTLQVQSVAAGTSNTAGTNFTIAGSKGTGTGAGGSIIFQVAPAGTTGTSQNALATALTIASDKSATFAGTIVIPSSYTVPPLATTAGGTTGLGQYGSFGAVIIESGNATVAAGYSGVRVSSAGNFGFVNSTNVVLGTQDTFITRAAAASIQLGAADAAAPVAQTLQVQSVVAGTSNTAGADFVIGGSKGTGTGAGGAIKFKTAPVGTTGTSQNALADAWAIGPSQSLYPTATLSTSMTNGFINIPGAAGAPAGTPANTTGFPMYWDSTNLQLYIYTGGAWKKSAAFT